MLNATINIALNETYIKDGGISVYLPFKAALPSSTQWKKGRALQIGNYLDMNLPMANYWGAKYAALLENIDETRLIYPE